MTAPAEPDHRAMASDRPARRIAEKFDKLSLLALLIPLAFGLYLSFAMAGVNVAPGETGLAAESLLATGAIANPYALPTGPTAHVSPVHVGLIAAIYGVFGADSAAARTVLSLVCLGAYLAGVWAVLVFCRNTRLGVAARATALSLTCVLPSQLFAAVVTLRQWDQPFCALILMASLLIATDPALPDRPRYRPEMALAALTGLAGLVSPSAMPTLLVAIGTTLWTRTRLRDWRPAVLTALIIAAMLAPWGLRNRAELGQFVLTRSNFALELAVGNHDGATGRSETDFSVHPHDSPKAAQHMRAVGEAAYMAEMGRTARAWIAGHPAAFATLTVTRIRLLLLPDSSIVGWTPVFGAIGALVLAMALAWLRIAALLLMIARRSRPVLWLAHCLLPLAPYAVTHVNLRYEFPVLFTSICLVCAAVDRCARIVFPGAALSDADLSFKPAAPGRAG